MAANLTAKNLDMFEEFEDFAESNLTDVNLESLKEIKDLSAVILTAAKLVLQSHIRVAERR